MPFITQGRTNLTYLLIVVILAIIVGGGILSYYYSWIRELETKLAAIELKLSPEEVTPELPTTKKKFDSAKIGKLISFYDSNRIEKKIFVYNTFDENGQIAIYLTDKNLTWGSAIKIIDIVGSDIRNSPFISAGVDEEKYIVIELQGGDNLTLVIADEKGGLIVKPFTSLIYEDPELKGYNIFFEYWESSSSFWAKVVSFAEGPPPFKVLVDTKTGKIIEKKPLSQ